jgi:hypothetical protein
MGVGEHEDCPACGATVAGENWCGSCGLEQHGGEAEELRSLAAKLAAAETELNVVWARRDALAKQLAGRRWARGLGPAVVAPSSPARPTVARPTPVRTKQEWDTDRVRNVLLWTGATLLVFAALAFTAVAWTHLGPAGRAELLVFVTLVAAVGAIATRKRLPATSGALTGLCIALAVVDWQIARRAGVAPGLSGAAWWAIGTATIAAASFALGRVAAPLPAHRAVAVLAPASAVLTLASSASAAWSGALGLSALAAVLVGASELLRRRRVDPVVPRLLRVEAGASWWIGVGFAIAAAFGPHTVVQTLVPAAVMATLALAPGLRLLGSTRPISRRVAVASLVIAPFIAAALVVASTSVGTVGLITLAAVLGCAAIAIAPSLTELWRRAAQVVGQAAAFSGVVFVLGVASISELGPLAWLGYAWTGAMDAKAANVVAGPHTTVTPSLGWCAVGILACLAVTISLAFRPARGAPARSYPLDWRAVAGGVAFLAIGLAPIAGGATALVACVVVTVGLAVAVLGAALLGRSHPGRAVACAWLAVLAAAPAMGWAAVTATASIVVLASVVLVALSATAIGRVPSLRAGHASLAAAAAVSLGAIVALAAGASLATAGFGAGCVAGVLLVIGSLARRDTYDGIALEVVGAIGILAGVALAWGSAAWMAGTLTAAVPALSLARLRGHRRVLYAASGAAAALAATWAWLFAADVSVLEAYTLPAAAFALFAGRLAHRDGPARSWLDYGPALALLLGPTLVLALARNDDARAIAVGLGALAILLVGARRGLQAPIVLGALTLVVLGVDKLGPAAVRLPRWIMLAFAGSLLLWVGSTFERRRAGAQRAARRFERLS